MQNIFEVDYENVLVDTMLQHRKNHAPVSLFIDCERDPMAATKYMLKRMGVNVDMPHASEAERNVLRGHALKLSDIHFSSIEHAASSLLKLKTVHGRVAVYARVLMSDTHTAEFLKAASAADHLVVVTV